MTTVNPYCSRVDCVLKRFNLQSKNIQSIADTLKKTQFSFNINMKSETSSGVPKGGGGSGGEPVLCMSSIDEPSPCDQDDVYRFINIVQTKLLQNNNDYIKKEENLKTLAKLMTITKIARDTWYGMFHESIKTEVKLLVKSIQEVSKLDLAHLNDQFILDNETTDDEATTRLIHALFQEGEERLVLLLSNWENAPSAHYIQIVYDKTDGSGSLKSYIHVVDEEGAVPPYDAEVLVIDFSNIEELKTNVNEKINTVSQQVDEEDEEDEDKIQLPKIAEWVQMMKAVVDAMNNLPINPPTSGGAARLRLPSKAREFFRVPVRITGDEAVTYIKERFTKSDISAYLGLKSSSHLSKDQLVMRVFKK
jgi:hypothetical protein